ncbi:hypothetical protein GH714_029279 [Hevea brasiliensis]|uniref:UBE2O-like SH3-B domain-containing protein n=1 Tax=Hevea brasiliensis TaxID=3981 RepID=A0A6A6NAR7_HEVBR|nr:hypothetical protein GH714_029279 [Hevea brasiliensis]
MGSEQNEKIPKVNELTTRIDDKNTLKQSGSIAQGSGYVLNADSENNDVNKLNEVVMNLHNVPYIYRQDIMRHKNTGTIGKVNEVTGAKPLHLKPKSNSTFDVDENIPYYPGQRVRYVEKKASDDINNASEARPVGVVKSGNAKERTACVRWLKPVTKEEDPHEFDKEEIVSVYELDGHPNYSYSYGDVVVRSSQVPVSALATSDRESKKGDDVSSDEACMDGFNGMLSSTFFFSLLSVGPQTIFVVGQDDDDDVSVTTGHEVSYDAASRETVDDDDEMDALENAQEEIELQNDANVNSEAEESVENNNSGRKPAPSFPLAALDFVTRDFGDETSLQKSNVIDNGVVQSSYGKVEEHAIIDLEVLISSNAVENLCNLSTDKYDASTCFEDDTCSLKHFDIAKDPLDHYFLGSNSQSAYHHSGGWQINPNLYEEGNVCLRLLNTWTGRANEVWDPMSFSILQVLVSLQGLGLNSKPYFNEAGYDKQTGTAEGEKNSPLYNEIPFY